MPIECQVGDLTISTSGPLTIIGGPCLLESHELALQIGRTLKEACDAHGLQYVFKASFDKANRTSVSSPRGPGLEDGLSIIARIRDELGVPVTTDLHAPEQAPAVARAADLLQIPAFLCRQSDLLAAAGAAAKDERRAVNIKKGQFLSPGEMAGPIGKLLQQGCENIMLTERGTTFGYGRLVNDFLGVVDMMELVVDGRGPWPVCFDCTHSTQLPGAGATTGGRPERAPALACAALAAGASAIFLETHPDPARAQSDGATMIPLDQARTLLSRLSKIRAAIADAGDL